MNPVGSFGKDFDFSEFYELHNRKSAEEYLLSVEGIVKETLK